MKNELDKKNIGSRIRLLRKSKKMTMKQFGDFLGDVPQSIVSRWESGSSVPNNERLALISKKTGVTMSFLLEGKKTFQDLHALDIVHDIGDLKHALDHKMEDQLSEEKSFVVRYRNENGFEEMFGGISSISDNETRMAILNLLNTLSKKN